MSDVIFHAVEKIIYYQKCRWHDSRTLWQIAMMRPALAWFRKWGDGKLLIRSGHYSLVMLWLWKTETDHLGTVTFFHTIITRATKLKSRHYTYIGSYQELSIWPQVLGDFSSIKTVHRVKLLNQTFLLTNIKRWATRQIWGIWKLRPAYSPETPNLGQNRWCFVPCDLEIWWMTLENNRASLLCCFKLCAIFHSHRWIQTGVTVRKRPIWVKINDF